MTYFLVIFAKKKKKKKKSLKGGLISSSFSIYSETSIKQTPLGPSQVSG